MFILSLAGSVLLFIIFLITFFVKVPFISDKVIKTTRYITGGSAALLLAVTGLIFFLSPRRGGPGSTILDALGISHSTATVGTVGNATVVQWTPPLNSGAVPPGLPATVVTGEIAYTPPDSSIDVALRVFDTQTASWTQLIAIPLRLMLEGSPNDVGIAETMLSTMTPEYTQQLMGYSTSSYVSNWLGTKGSVTQSGPIYGPGPVYYNANQQAYIVEILSRTKLDAAASYLDLAKNMPRLVLPASATPAQRKMAADTDAQAFSTYNNGMRSFTGIILTVLKRRNYMTLLSNYRIDKVTHNNQDVTSQIRKEILFASVASVLNFDLYDAEPAAEIPCRYDFDMYTALAPKPQTLAGYTLAVKGGATSTVPFAKTIVMVSLSRI